MKTNKHFKPLMLFALTVILASCKSDKNTESVKVVSVNPDYFIADNIIGEISQETHGGHVNPNGGYHYHAATGSTKEVDQTDVHASLLGYAIDGFGIYALLDENKNQPTDLDDCGGHEDSIRGYHYHAGEPGGNQVIKCLHGISGNAIVQE